MENRLTFLRLNRHETVGKSELCIKQGSKNPRFGIEARVREQKYFIYMN